MSKSKSPSKKKAKTLPAEQAPKIHTIPTRRKRVAAFCAAMKKERPDPKCELYFESPYQLLVSVVLSAQTTDKSVNRVMRPLYEQGFTIRTVLRWGKDKFQEHIKTIGLAPTKAKNVVALSQQLKEKHGSEVPNSRTDLEALPGVGRKTANVILGELFGHPTLAVDTHVFRVGRRLGLHNEPTPEKAEQVLLKVVAEDFLPQAHHWFILHGRYHCTARSPGCNTCAVAGICPSFKALRPDA